MIQIDMEMPVSCSECPARDEEYDACAFFELRGHEDWCSNFLRPDSCPLKEADDKVGKAEAEARGNLRLYLREKRICEHASREIYRRLMEAESKAVYESARKAYRDARRIVSEEWNQDPKDIGESLNRVRLF